MRPRRPAPALGQSERVHTKLPKTAMPISLNVFAAFQRSEAIWILCPVVRCVEARRIHRRVAGYGVSLLRVTAPFWVPLQGSAIDLGKAPFQVTKGQHALEEHLIDLRFFPVDAPQTRSGCRYPLPNSRINSGPLP